jgi:hypothetical protein
MAAPQVMSDEQLFQLTGSWEAAAALRDEQYNALNQYNNAQAATAGGGMLSGNILAGASWNSLNDALAGQLTEATGQQTSNYAVGGATTADTLNQLNTFISGGGTFDPNATVFLQTGGVDFIQGVDKNTVKDNINQIVKTLGDQGVNVVLTGSPYAASIQDVQTNNFNPEVDQIFKDIAKENKNVALVGTQGEILQNKSLLVDALHTNAEGTAIYNQSVMDALSQFKNDVPVSTPQAITQAQQTNRVIPTARGTVIEGDDIEAQMAGVPQSVYETRVDPNNKANWQTVNPATGEVINSGTFAGGGDQGLLAASRPVLALAASVLGAPYLSNLIAGSTGLTGSALAGATGATIAGGSTALTGGSAEDTLRAALLGGGGGYLGSEFNNYFDTGTFADPGITERQFAILDAQQLSSQGLSPSQIRDTMLSGGYNDIIIDRALAALPPITTPTGAISTPVLDNAAVNITGAANPALNVGGMLSSVTSPVVQAGTVNVNAPRTPQQIDQATLALINSQLAANLGTPANLANVQVTADRPSTTPSNAIGNVAATLTSQPPTSSIPTQTITAPRETLVGDVLATLPASMLPPSVTNAPPTTPAKKTNELGLTDEQMANLLRAGLGLFGTLGATSALSNRGTTVPVGSLPTQLPPMYTDDYFTKVQQNYNRLLPAVPRDVASPLRDWYTSQYGA